MPRPACLRPLADPYADGVDAAYRHGRWEGVATIVCPYAGRARERFLAGFSAAVDDRQQSRRRLDALVAGTVAVAAS